MCGICGIVHDGRSAEPDREALARMNAALAHRGPDDAGEWIAPGAALAMRRLGVIDLPCGAQPMTTEDGRWTLVFNGELYNFAQLRRELEALGHAFRTQSDTEVVLRAFAQWGAEAVHRFNGMFAIAAWDAQDETLRLVRDRLGIKPLFYTHRNGVLAFASELDALRIGGFAGEIDPGALDAYFTYLYIPAPDTIYREVYKLRPGEMLTFRKGRLATETYWRPEYDIDPAWTLDTAADRFLELLTDSVRLQRVADVPLGCFLSGGVDSSTVAAILAHVTNGPIQTFTIGFDDAHADELPFARAAAERIGSEHHETIVKPDLTTLLPEIARHFGEPFADSSALPTWIVSQAARRKVTVALSGDGGDELFAGYAWTRMNANVARYRILPAPLRRFIDSALFLAPRTHDVRKLRKFSADAFMEPFRSFKRRHTCFDDEQRRALLLPPVLRAAEGTDRFAEHGRHAGDIGPEDWMLFQDTSMYLPDDILTKVDRMSMAHSLEVRVPLLDHRIVEFAATVPFSLKLRGGVSKRVMKRAAKALLPASLLRQRKQGFAIPVQRWMRNDLQPMLRDLLLGPDARSMTYLRRPIVENLIDDHAADKAQYGHHLWAILMLEHTLRGLESPQPKE